MAQKTEETTEIRITPIKTKTLKVRVGSLDGSTYIPHRLTNEIAEEITAREVGKSKQKKLRDFDEEFERCFYYTPDKKYGIPASAFMAAILEGTKETEIPKAQIKRVVRVLGDVYPLKYKKMERRVDFPRRSGRTGAPDVRHRPEFIDWSCDIIIEYATDRISPDQIVNLLGLAGFHCGVGDWRPSSPRSSGTHGMFRVMGNQ